MSEQLAPDQSQTYLRLQEQVFLSSLHRRHPPVQRFMLAVAPLCQSAAAATIALLFVLEAKRRHVREGFRVYGRRWK
eukprot:COSAG05_NODE_155_length_15704_cov_84.777315_16_plen_77_part_00